MFFVFYVLYFFWIENPTPTSNILLVRVFRDDAINIPEQVDTTGWLQYTNSSLGFSMQYPAGYRVTEEQIVYGEYEGKLLDFQQTGAQTLSLRAFPAVDNETIAQAYERLTGVSPDVYQSFTEEVADTDALVYRLTPGINTNDSIYFIGNSYLFEMPYNQTAAKVLATFNFIET